MNWTAHREKSCQLADTSEKRKKVRVHCPDLHEADPRERAQLVGEAVKGLAGQTLLVDVLVELMHGIWRGIIRRRDRRQGS
jgi:hypothetical protein